MRQIVLNYTLLEYKLSFFSKNIISCFHVPERYKILNLKTDKRRFNFTDQEYKSKLGNNYNFKKKNFPTLAGMKDRYIQHKDLAVDMLLLEFFHDDDKDYVAVESGDDEEEVDELDQIEELDQGMISSNGLLLFYEKKFSRCPGFCHYLFFIITRWV